MSRSVTILMLFAFFGAATIACSKPPEGVPEPLPQVDAAAYPWLAQWPEPPPELAPLEALFPAPEGSARVAAAEGSFAAWLRGLPVRLDRDRVHAYNGAKLGSSPAVILLDLGSADLQQCADTLIRLHAEFLWSHGLAARAEYHFTSGDLSTWPAWVAGERFQVRGSSVRRLTGAPRADDHTTFRAWLQQLFVYAGTMSLALDSEPVADASAVQPGDFFVDPGSPGHTVIVLDVVERADSSRLGLIGQGYTPAQDLHVISSRNPSIPGGVWFQLPGGPEEVLDVPTWNDFPRATARRFKVPRN